MAGDGIFSAIVLLLLVIDPFGNVPLVAQVLASTPRERRVRVILRECAAAYVVLLAFMLGGRSFLNLLQLSDVSLSIAGGIILFLIALRMVFLHPEGVFGGSPHAEPFLVPLAIPMIAGPSALATVMLMVSRDPARLYTWMVALSVAMAATTLVLLAAFRLEAGLGDRGMQAIQRLMGLVLTAIAVQMLLNGISSFISDIPR